MRKTSLYFLFVLFIVTFHATISVIAVFSLMFLFSQKRGLESWAWYVIRLGWFLEKPFLRLVRHCLPVCPWRIATTPRGGRRKGYPLPAQSRLAQLHSQNDADRGGHPDLLCARRAPAAAGHHPLHRR